MLIQFIRYTTHSQKWFAHINKEPRAHGFLYKADRKALRHSVHVQLNIRMGKTSELIDFEHGMIFDARRVSSSISETASLLGFSRTTVSRVYREWCDNQKTSSQRQSCGRKQHVDEQGRRRARILQANRRATNRHITAQYGITERTSHRSLSRMAIAAENHTGFHSCQLKTRSGSSGHMSNTIEWKNIAWSNESHCGTMMARFGVSSMSPWPHPKWCRQYRLVAMV